MHYTYILESIGRPNKHYIGHSSDLKARLIAHNTGKCRYTTAHRPWRLKAYLAFDSLPIARNFEKYLKSGSGHAFAQRHFFPDE